MSLLKIKRLSQSCCFVIVLFASVPAFCAIPKSKLDSVFNISCAFAEILGVVNPRGLDTSYRFDCLSSSGSVSSAWFIVVGSDPVDVIYNLKDLKQNTEYRVSIYACNIDGCDFSNVKTFITKKCKVKVLQWREVY